MVDVPGINGPLPIPDTLVMEKAPQRPGVIVDFDSTSCAATDHALFMGASGDFQQVTAAVCSIGAAATVELVPPAGDVWFLVAGVEGQTWSSVGQSSGGLGGPSERVLTGVSAVCPMLGPQDTTGICPCD